MAGGEQNTARSLSQSDDMTGCRCGENAVLTDEELLDAIRSTDLGDQLDDLWIPEATITADDEE